MSNNMSISDQFTLALQVFRELETELGQRKRDVPPPPAPGIEQLVQDAGSLPADSLLLGIAADGLPLLLDLYDPAPGPVLVTGDKGCGKTAFLQMLAQTSDLMPGPGDVQFGVITHAPEEWTEVEALPGSMGVWPAAHSSAGRFLNRLVAWGGHPHNDGRTVALLLVDGLDALALSDSVTRQDLRWLLTYGPEHRIWPVVTFNAGRAPRFASWLELFGLFIYGAIRQPNLAEALTGDASADLQSLFPGLQFSLHKPDGWLKFWIPSFNQGRSNE
jgi:hypothetical protein